MKKIKYLLYFVIFICLMIVVVSNWTFFSAMQALDINVYQPTYSWPFDLKLHKLAYHIPPAATGVYLLGCFIAGFLLSNFNNLVVRYKNTKQIKQLETANKAQTTKLEDLQKEVDFLQRNASKPSPAAAPIEKTEPVGEEAVTAGDKTEETEFSH